MSLNDNALRQCNLKVIFHPKITSGRPSQPCVCRIAKHGEDILNHGRSITICRPRFSVAYCGFHLNFDLDL